MPLYIQALYFLINSTFVIENMHKSPQAGNKLEGVLRETLLEISHGKTDPFHRVVADVVEEITAPDERIHKKTEKLNE